MPLLIAIPLLTDCFDYVLHSAPFQGTLQMMALIFKIFETYLMILLNFTL